MARRMLINATRPEEVRVAIVQDKTLESFEVAASESGLIKGNIYRGLVVNVRSGLEAAFVDIGTGKDALLRAEDIVAPARHRKPDGNGKRQRIESIVDKGKPIIVQVSRDPIAHKGAQVTTNLSLAGRYLVVMPFDDVRGVSRRTEDEEVRTAAKEKISAMDLPDDIGVIVRTNALDQPKAALNRDLSALLRLWKKIKREGNNGKGTKLLYSDQDLVVQALRDHLDSSIAEVLVDDDEVFKKAQGYMASFMPRAKTRFGSLRGPPSTLQPVRARRADRPYLPAQRRSSVGRFDRHRQHRGPDGDRRQLGPRYARRQPGGECRSNERRGRSGGWTAASFARHRRSYRGRFHRHAGDQEQPARGKDAEGLDEGGQGAVQYESHLVKRAARDQPPADQEGVATAQPPGLPHLCGIRGDRQRGVGRTRPDSSHRGPGRNRRSHGRPDRAYPELADALQNERRQELAALEREFDLGIEVIAATGLHRSEERSSGFGGSAELQARSRRPWQPSVRLTSPTVCSRAGADRTREMQRIRTGWRCRAGG